jgi:GWxTD domain-containing protein
MLKVALATRAFNQVFSSVVKTVALTMICLLGNGAELSTSSLPQPKSSCDYLETWLSQDVGYIIPDTERVWARGVRSRKDCAVVVQQFWAPRDPTPDTINNEFKEEFYDRILYANAHFGTGDRIGWKTDRGRVYITWGPPDRIEAGTRAHSSEIWRYLNKDKHYGLEGSIEFEDPAAKGNHRIIPNDTAQRALSKIPNTRSDIKELPGGKLILCGRPPQIQFKDLETILNVGLTYNLLPFTCRVEQIRVTESTVLVVIVVDVQKENLTDQQGKQTQLGAARVFGLIRKDKTPLDIFEATLSAAPSEGPVESPSADFLRFRKALPLFSGTYRIELAIREFATGRLGTLYRAITVP